MEAAIKEDRDIVRNQVMNDLAVYQKAQELYSICDKYSKIMKREVAQHALRKKKIKTTITHKGEG